MFSRRDIFFRRYMQFELLLAISVLFILDLPVPARLIILIMFALLLRPRWRPRKTAAEPSVEQIRPQPLDMFNTYQNNDFDAALRDERMAYSAGMEYPEYMVDAISAVYTGKEESADDACARRQRYMQEQSREAIDNRARMNPNSFRMYFGEEQETAENMSWWGVDQANYSH